MQHSPVVNPGMPALSAIEDGTDLELLPEKAAEPPNKDQLKQIWAPTDVRGLLESPWGETLQHTTWQVSQTWACPLGGKMPIEEMHGHPPDLPDLYPQGFIVPKSVSVGPKAYVHIY
jgi:hypothetical protein